MITLELIESPEWEKAVSNQLELNTDSSNQDKSLNEIFKEVSSHYLVDGQRNLAYLGKLLVARNNVRLYGGGDVSYLAIDPIAQAILWNGELSEINTQLEALAILELEANRVIAPGNVPSNIRELWNLVAEEVDDKVDEFHRQTGQFVTAEAIADGFIRTLLEKGKNN